MIHPVPSTTLSADVVKAAIQDSCAKASATNEALSFESLVQDKVKDLFAVFNIQVSKRALDELDKYHGVTFARDGSVVGGATFNFAYSTSDGRILCVDKMEAKNSGDEEHILRLLGDVAVQLECQCLVWQHYDAKRVLYEKELGAQVSDKWLTLRMNKEAINTFLSGTDAHVPTLTTGNVVNVDSAIAEAIEANNKSLERSDLRLHLATAEDVETIEHLVIGLATYHKELESVHLNKNHFAADGFGTDHSWFKCLLLEDTRTSQMCGIALFFFGYNVERGSFLYLEELYIEKSCRGRSGGKVLMSTLATVATLLDCFSFVWQALDWNTPALNFYAKVGARIQDGLLTSKFGGAQLATFVEGGGS